jgi:hypothetical protein
MSFTFRPLVALLWITVAVPYSRTAPLDIWQARDSGISANLLGISFGNATFVAVGENGTVLTSSNGVSWVSQAPPTTNDLHEVCYGDDRFVAVGDHGTILSSSNGVQWLDHGLGMDAYLRGITPAATGFVAVGFSEGPPLGAVGLIFQSLNGVEWTIVPAEIHNHLEAVTYADGHFVAVGYFQGEIFVSTNGSTWNLRQPCYNVLLGATHGSGMFVLAGVDSYTPNFPVLISQNADQWQAQRAGGIAPYAVAFGAGTFVMVGEILTDLEFKSAISTSRNGAAWTLRLPGTNGRLNSVSYGAGTFVAVGVAGMILQSEVSSGTLAVTQALGTNGVTLRLTGEPGRQYRLQAAPDLATDNWSELAVISNASPSIIYFDQTAANHPARFYRLIAE